MLVLTRKSNQSIMIGDDIEVSVLAIMGEKVRIGIQAPRDVPVFRKEVYLEIQQERTDGPQALGKRWMRALRRAVRTRPDRSGPASDQQQVQRFEHRGRDDQRGRDQRQHEHPVAHRAALPAPLVRAPAGPVHGLAPESVPAAPVQLRLVPELLLELREALAHLHRHRDEPTIPAAG